MTPKMLDTRLGVCKASTSPSREVTIMPSTTTLGNLTVTSAPDKYPPTGAPLLEPTALRDAIARKVVGQQHAIQAVVDAYSIWRASFHDTDRPISSFLFPGPTGVGKTRLVEAFAEVLFGSSKEMLKIDCAEYQHSHEIAKLLGSPPGYLGHRETKPLLSEEFLKRGYTAAHPFAIILFDEIEKSSNALWRLMLGILDKGSLTLGDGSKPDLRSTFIFMTTNCGVKEAQKKRISFLDSESAEDEASFMRAVRQRFDPEFLNRMDSVTVFKRLTADECAAIVRLELRAVGARLTQGTVRELYATPELLKWLLKSGISVEYGGRELRRTIQRCVTLPLARWYLAMFPKGVILRDLPWVLVLDVDNEKLVVQRGKPKRDAVRVWEWSPFDQ